MKVTVFYASHCIPCHEVVDNMQNREVALQGADNVELVDVESEEGFSKIGDNNIETIPVAIREDGKTCRIFKGENDTVLIDCDDENENHTEEPVHPPADAPAVPA